MGALHRRRLFFPILIGMSLIAFAWGVLIPAGGQDQRGHLPGIAHPDRHHLRQLNPLGTRASRPQRAAKPAPDPDPGMAAPPALNLKSTQMHRHDPDGAFSDPKGAPEILFTPDQAEEVTLRFARVEEHRIEKWARTAGKSTPREQTLEGRLFGPEAKLIQRGQQVRIFPLVGAHRMLQGKVTGITLKNAREALLEPIRKPPQRPSLTETSKEKAEFPDRQLEAQVKVHFRGPWHREANLYVMEIIVPMGSPLSIPHEAIIEEDGEKIVFVKDGKNRCQRRAISVGIRGEIYEEILSGLQEGEEVATFGSFFLEAEYQLKRRSTRRHLGENH